MDGINGINGIAKVAQKPVEQKQEQPQEIHPPLYSEGAEKYSPHIYNYFGLSDMDRYREMVNDSIDTIVRWTGEKELPNILRRIKELELELGTPPRGMTRLTQLANFAKIDAQIQRLHSERELYRGRK